ncbi:MAG: hypothetical protein BM562_04865 [Alphaproteobacteria bacterium MedPE-SWcel]|nr:MAG: hypothetical protein BM562_04865 [Alphaproteobacteria bacterium MedPE-SWcel]
MIAHFFNGVLKKRSSFRCRRKAFNRLNPNIERPKKTSNLKCVDQIGLPFYLEHSLARIQVKCLTRQTKPVTMAGNPG